MGTRKNPHKSPEINSVTHAKLALAWLWRIDHEHEGSAPTKVAGVSGKGDREEHAPVAEYDAITRGTMPVGGRASLRAEHGG